MDFAGSNKNFGLRKSYSSLPAVYRKYGIDPIKIVGTLQESWLSLIKELHSNIPQLAYIGVDDIKKLRYARIYESLKDAAQKAYRDHEEEIIGFYNSIMTQYDPNAAIQEKFVNDNIMRGLERDVLLRVVDNQWIDHLHNIDMLKEGIGLRAYGQKDPLIEYKKEAYDLFNKMMHSDPLDFEDTKKYTDRLKSTREKTKRQDSVVIGCGRMNGYRVVSLLFNFDFMGGSMGSGVGEAFMTAADYAVSHGYPFLVVPCSGGARMQEGIFSLMQMPLTRQLNLLSFVLN